MLRFRMGMRLGSDRHNLGFALHTTCTLTVKLQCRGFVPPLAIAFRMDGGSTRRSQRAPHRPPGWPINRPLRPAGAVAGLSLAGARLAQAHIRNGWRAGLLAGVWVWVRVEGPGGGSPRAALPQTASQPTSLRGHTPPERRPDGRGRRPPHAWLWLASGPRAGRRRMRALPGRRQGQRIACAASRSRRRAISATV